MKIAILCPKSEFIEKQREQMASFGEVVYTESREEYLLEDLKKLAEGAVILGADPDNLGGFEKAKERLTELMEILPELKGVALASTSYSWIDLDYCRKRSIVVTNVPHYSTESVAEHVLGLLISLAKKIIISDRRTQKGKYKLDMGFELKGKTLGIIGLGDIGLRVAELGNGIGMKVIAYNRSSKQVANVQMKPLSEVLAESDAISINVALNDETRDLISKEELSKVKDCVIIVNLAPREVVNEEAMAEALKSRKVASYAFEGEDLESGPLADVETAIGLKPFAWYTKEALDRAAEIWTKSILSIAKGNPVNVVS
jgi:lactate dehydrogenase-like 2-hydroxyacid dehydrogenase